MFPTLPITVTALAVVVALVVPRSTSIAATPPSVTLSPSLTTATWEGPYSGPEANKNDLLALKIDVPPNYWDTHGGGLSIDIQWENPANDFNLFLHRDGRQIESQQGNGTTSESIFFPSPAPGDYVVRVYYLGVTTSRSDGSAYGGSVSITARSDVIFDDSDPVEFAPATVVSAHFLGSEPQVAMERAAPGSDPHRVDPDRVFVDWPLTARHQIGQIARSTDGGDSFRLLFDPACAERSRPTCQSGGGGDTDTAVSPFDGDLFFSDQQGSLAHEALASSTTHGDSFPPERQHTITNPAFLMDRQWLTTANPGPGALKIDGRTVEAFLTTRVLGVGMYVQGIDENGTPIAQPEPQLPNDSVAGGPLRVDTTGAAKGWLYQPYDDGAFKIATVDGIEFRDPERWELTTVSPDDPVLFPWIDLDSAGNAYAAWVAQDGNRYSVFYSSSPIADPRNDPATGRPGTYWTPQARVSLPVLGSTVFPAITAGDPGRVAITYMGTSDFGGKPDDVPFPYTARWHTYGAVMTNALAQNGPPVVSTGRVSHRVGHVGSICTDGALCEGGGDRSLLDLIDIGHDQDGRAAVTFMDNHSTFARPKDATVSGFPFVHFAKQVSGPSLRSDDPGVDVTIDEAPRPDVIGDATWPNTAAGRHLTTLDLEGASLSLEGTDLIARLPLPATSHELMKLDLASYNAAMSTNPPAERLQYVLRFADENDVFHLSMEAPGNGSRAFFGGKLDANDALDNGFDVFGAGYHRDDIPVTGAVTPDGLEIRAPASAFGLEAGDRLFSVTGFSMAGPSETTEETIFNIMRTVDATPPYDMTLQAAVQPAPSPTVSVSASPAAGATLMIAPAESTGSPGSAHEVSARLTDPSGEPIEGASISWSSVGVGQLSRADATTDADGRAEAELLSDDLGDQTVTASVADCEGTCAATATRHWGPARCDVFGTSQNDLLYGVEDSRVVCAFGGHDTVVVTEGEHLVLGAGGNDRLFGAESTDDLRGGGGDDELRGRGGRDRIRAGGGVDFVYGGGGDDFIRSGRGDDLVRGGSGRDRCSERDRQDTVSGCEA